MLVLELEPGELVYIGDTIKVRFMEADRGGKRRARIAIDAPRGVRVIRASLLVPGEPPPFNPEGTKS